MEKVFQSNSGLLYSCVEKTGYCSSVPLSCVGTVIDYFQLVNCKFELMVHFSVKCNGFYGSASFVYLSGDDAVYCLSLGIPPLCGKRSCRDCCTSLLLWKSFPACWGLLVWTYTVQNKAWIRVEKKKPFRSGVLVVWGLNETFDSVLVPSNILATEALRSSTKTFGLVHSISERKRVFLLGMGGPLRTTL